MKQLHTFDEVFDSQKVFRKALEVLSNPGRTLSIAGQSEKLYGEPAGPAGPGHDAAGRLGVLLRAGRCRS